jgi:hypothetical protein
MTLKEKIIEIINKHEYWTSGAEMATDEITALIEKDYYEKGFTEWFENNVDKVDSEYFIIEEQLAWRTVYKNAKYYTLDEVYDYWKLNVKEMKDTITTSDLKSIDQSRDNYYNRDKLMERKK